MPSGIPGDVSRKSQSTIESHHVGDQFAAFGLFGKLSATTGDFVPLESTDTAAAVYGLWFALIQLNQHKMKLVKRYRLHRAFKMP